MIPALLLIGYLALQLIKGKQDEAKKGALLLIAAAALTDFHMQYLVIAMAAALCLDLGQDEKARKGKQGSAKENIILMFIPLFAFLYFLVAFAAFSIGNDEAGLKFYPYYTDARIRQLEQETSPEKAGVLAGEVLKLAPCTSKAYISLAAIAALEADSRGMCDNMDKAIDCARYDTDCYRLYDRFLSDMIMDDRVSPAEAERSLGNPTKKTVKEEGKLRYEYPLMDVAYDYGAVVGMAADDASVSTPKGIHAGSSLQEVLNKYGSDYMLSTYDNLDLYEYKFTDENKRPYLLRFAIRQDTGNVKYISIRYVD